MTDRRINALANEAMESIETDDSEDYAHGRAAIEQAIRCALSEHDAESDKFAYWLRREWWFHHGCNEPVALYGDDGEMQCSKCRTDFKREDIYVLKAKVLGQRIGLAQQQKGG